MVIHNRTAGHAVKREREFLHALAILAEAGWSIQVKPTDSQGHAAALARDAAQSGADVVVAAGGDGTVNEVVQGLAHTKAALACLPLGTVNVWSREVGFSTSITDAAKQLTVGRTVRVDLGKVDDRFFLLMAGVGVDAEVTAVLGEAAARKQRFGVIPYVLRAAQVLPQYTGASIQIEVNGQSAAHDALMVLIANTRLYGGIARPTPEAVANDGMLDVRVFHGRRPVDTLRQLVPFLLSRGRSRPADIIRTNHLRVDADPPLAVQVDGDPMGTTPIEIEVAHRALRAIVSSSPVASLMAGHDE